MFVCFLNQNENEKILRAIAHFQTTRNEFPEYAPQLGCLVTSKRSFRLLPLNARNASDYFSHPDEQVIELGMLIDF